MRQYFMIMASFMSFESLLISLSKVEEELSRTTQSLRSCPLADATMRF